MTRKGLYLVAVVVLAMGNGILARLAAAEPPTGACWCFLIGDKKEPFCLETTEEPECATDNECPECK